MSDSTAKNRPEFRNIGLGDITNYHLPLAGKVSILHRISGVLLFFAIPIILLPLLSLSFSSEGFEKLTEINQSIVVKLILLALIWSFCHHFCAGIRFLLLDVHMGVDKYKSCKTAASVLIISLLLTVLFGLFLFGVL